jgi:hypothetical protein
MVLRSGPLLISGFLVAVCAFGQIGFPGQFPGGQYPGGGYPGGSSIPFPGRGRTNPQNNQGPVTTFNGVLRRVEGSDIVVQSDDKRIVTISFSNITRYYKASGGSGRLRDFEPGDRVSVDATEDNNGYYYATRVTQIAMGTSDERTAALPPWGRSTIRRAHRAVTRVEAPEIQMRMTIVRDCTVQPVRMMRRHPRLLPIPRPRHRSPMLRGPVSMPTT